MFVSECAHVCVRVSALYMHFHMCAYLWSQRQSIFLTLHSIILDFFLFLCLYICDTCVWVSIEARSQVARSWSCKLLCQPMRVIGTKVGSSALPSIPSYFLEMGASLWTWGFSEILLGFRYYTLTFLCGYCLSELKSSCFTASVLPTEPSP